MSDEPAKIILGDTAISAFERTGGKRRSGRGEDSAPPLTHCENCGADLKGHWCAKCGQPAIEYRRSFRYVVSDLLNEFLNWDSKFFTTIALLILKPWRLTNEFLAGKRVRYVNPLRLYLLASILFFFAVNYGAKGIRIDPTKFPEEKRAEVAAAIADKRDEIEAELKKENLTPEQRRKAQKALEYLTKPTSSATTTPTPEETPSPSAAPGGSPTAESGGQQKYGPVGDRPFVVFDDAKSTTPFERWIEGRAKEKMGEQGTKMGLFISTLLSNLPYMMLCCIPLFALVLKLLYIRRRRFYIDHLIYALHIHSFFYAAVMLIVLLTIGLTRFTPGAIAGWLIALLWIAFVTQIFLSIRYVYRQGWFFSILKFLFGGFMYLVVLVLALAATFFATLLLPWE
jgi:ribosomal protein L32